jgi:hypothetical protein
VAQSLLHFVFTASGAGCLVQALRKADRDDQVIATFDDLSFGPIDPGDSSSRAKWVETEQLGQTGWNDGASSPERLWDEARFPDNRKIAWLTRRSAMEYAGFLNWLWRLGDERCEVVDLTDVKVPRRAEHGLPDLAISLSMLHPDLICDNRLWDLAKPLETNARTRYLDLWRQLRSENAPLRVVDGGELVSAPISFFDSTLVSFLTDDWQKVTRVVGEALACQMDDCILPDRRYFAGGRRQCLSREWSFGSSGRIAPGHALQRGEDTEGSIIHQATGRTS